MKKPSKSLFQVAAEKYTSISSDLKKSKQVFFEQLEQTTPMTAADLNKSYTGKDAGKTPPRPTFSNFGASNPGGSEKPAPVTQPAQVAIAPGQTAGPAAGQLAPPAAGAPAGPTPQQTALLTDPAAKKTVLPDGRVLIEDPKNPQIYVLQSADDAKKAGTAIRESVKATIYTVEDIMSALKTLSTGAVSEVSSVSNDDEDGVNPVGDTLIDPNDAEAPEDGIDGDDGGDRDDYADADVDEADDNGMQPSTSSEISSPSSGSGFTPSSSASTGSATSASSFQSNKPMEKKDNLTGVDDSYTQEGGTEMPAKEAPGKNKAFAKGAGQHEEDPNTANASAPEIGEGGAACGEGETCEANPSGKESAFWMPGDDLLGLKDIVGSVAKGNGVPDAQQTIAKDANGMLVKKPTTPMHSPPNMRQYVKTNGVPGAPSVIPQGGQPVDISDLDGVMGMDAKSDRALNISLNFNF